MTYVLYLNLWGTNAKLPRDEVSLCQTFFHQRVRLSAGKYAVEAYPLVDYAYVYSHHLAPLTAFAVEVFGAMIFPEGRAKLWPLRGAIAMGAQPAAGLIPIPWVGVGSVHAAELEKSAQKGMRLLIDHRAKDEELRPEAGDKRNATERQEKHQEAEREDWRPLGEPFVRVHVIGALG